MILLCLPGPSVTQDPLVMVVDGHRQDLLGPVLTDHMHIQQLPDLLWLRNTEVERSLPRVLAEFFIQDPLANRDAAIADVDSGPGDQFTDLGMTLSTETAHREVGCSSHKSLISTWIHVPKEHSGELGSGEVFGTGSNRDSAQRTLHQTLVQTVQ